MGWDEIQLCIKSVMKYEYRIGNNSISGNKSTLVFRSSSTYLYDFEYLPIHLIFALARACVMYLFVSFFHCTWLPFYGVSQFVRSLQGSAMHIITIIISHTIST